MIHDPLTLFTVLSGVIFAAVTLDHRYAWARKLSPVLLILFLAALLSNTGVIANVSPLYDGIVGFTVPFAVCLVLFKVQLGDFKRTGPPLLVAFFIACVGTCVGVLVASLALDAATEPILGPDRWKLAGPFTGTYIGGSLNFFALWSGLDIKDPDLFGAANAVDNLTLLPLFAVWIVLPRYFERFFPVASVWRPKNEEHTVEARQGPRKLAQLDMVTLAFLALLVMVISEFVAENVVAPVVPKVPTILVVTTFALILAQFRRVSRLEGSLEMGNLAFYVFFAAVGATINIPRALVLSPILFLYVAVIIAIHLIFTYGLGRLLRMDIRVLTIASCAAKSGPPVVLAIAYSQDWKSLALPGMALGILGYAIGNYAGIGTAYLVKVLLGL